MITQLLNNKGPAYNSFKNFVLGDNFPWFYNEHFVYKEQKEHYIESENENDISFLTHSFLNRPSGDSHPRSPKYPTVNSQHIDRFTDVLSQIFIDNDLQPQLVFRMNANMLYPTAGNQQTMTHVDHPWPHKNLIIYLTDAGGETVAGEHRHDPQEDDIITFEGAHYNLLPAIKRRVVLVATYA